MTKPLLIIPVENQVRELDAKLLLACVAAQRGYRPIIGWRWSIDHRLTRFPRGIYFDKSVIQNSLRMLRLKWMLGHKVIAWDEAALVHYYPVDRYYGRHFGRGALNLIDHYIVWGEENKKMIEGYSHLPKDLPIHVLGNPRTDLLRPECRSFFEKEVSVLKEQYGDYILFNSAFANINNHDPLRNLVNPDPHAKTGIKMARGSKGFPPDFARGLYRYRCEVFQRFQDLVRKVGAAYPERTVILRPHPGENHDFWHQFAAPYPNIVVRAEGNVIPWLQGCSVLIHSGCTTAIEGYALGTPIISYVPVDDSQYELQLPNRFGVRCDTDDDVLQALPEILRENRKNQQTARQDAILKENIHVNETTLASESIIDITDKISFPDQTLAQYALRCCGVVMSECRFIEKKLHQALFTKRYNQKFKRHRFPKLSVEIIEDKTARLCKIIGAKNNVQIKQLDTDIFEIS